MISSELLVYVKMILPIPDSAKSEVREFIRYLAIAKNETAANIYHETFSIYGDVMSCQKVADWYKDVNNGKPTITIKKGMWDRE